MNVILQIKYQDKQSTYSKDTQFKMVWILSVLQILFDITSKTTLWNKKKTHLRVS